MIDWSKAACYQPQNNPFEPANFNPMKSCMEAKKCFLQPHGSPSNFPATMYDGPTVRNCAYVAVQCP